MKRIEKLLIANRGEIAVRILATCRRMGIATVAVFSDADAGARFVELADEAVRIGPPPAIESYLDIARIIAAARLTGADAIHPGYGFLAENPALPAACAEAGLVFVGPTAEAIRLLGSKLESKRRVAGAEVPTIPGAGGADQSDAGLRAAALEIGFPVLLKASAGGGGKGMRVVSEAEALDDAIAAARRESMGAFGDDTLLVEKYIDTPRHVEFQILGDQHGKVIHLCERECSIQRRHQKIIEETPSPVMTPELRERMGRAAVAVGQAVGYQNAGTVEFILAPSGEFYFLEVNTRLQVEHPVTEMVTGIDLVRHQIRIAEGEPLALTQDQIAQSGAAIECRLYAEDADHGFLPTSGRIADWHAPDIDGLRIDTGVGSGDQVSIHYDPMLAKIICHAPTRAEAIQKMVRSLSLLAVQGVVTNREFLIRVLRHPEFRAGATDTHFLARHADDLAAAAAPDGLRRHAAIAATLSAFAARRAARTILPHLEPGFRNNPNGDEWVDYLAPPAPGSGDLSSPRATDDTIAVRYRNLGAGRLRFTVDGEEVIATLVSAGDDSVVYQDGDGHRRRARVVRAGDRWLVHTPDGALALTEKPRFPDIAAAEIKGGCIAPMPGKVVKVMVAEGQEVAAGAVVVILEAMKMEHAARCPEDGVVKQVLVAEGEQVDADALLVVVEPIDAETEEP